MMVTVSTELSGRNAEDCHSTSAVHLCVDISRVNIEAEARKVYTRVHMSSISVKDGQIGLSEVGIVRCDRSE